MTGIIFFNQKDNIQDEEDHSVTIKGIICLTCTYEQSLKIFKAKMDQITQKSQIQNNSGRFSSHLCNDRKSRLERKLNVDLKA